MQVVLMHGPVFSAYVDQLPRLAQRVKKANPRQPFVYDYAVCPTFGFAPSHNFHFMDTGGVHPRVAVRALSCYGTERNDIDS